MSDGNRPHDESRKDLKVFDLCVIAWRRIIAISPIVSVAERTA